ncbi:MAG TPA: rhodanese-like domain-containing protein [Polyangia bacterium]|jgi:adenylyltransferase/sulfurtransferase
MPRQISVEELARLRATSGPPLLLDVRQPWENETAALADSLLIPLPELDERWPEVQTVTQARPGVLIVAYCHHGVRSLSAAVILEANGVGPVVSLAGGIDAWSRAVDPSIPRY